MSNRLSEEKQNILFDMLTLRMKSGSGVTPFRETAAALTNALGFNVTKKNLEFWSMEWGFHERKPNANTRRRRMERAEAAKPEDTPLFRDKPVALVDLEPAINQMEREFNQWKEQAGDVVDGFSPEYDPDGHIIGWTEDTPAAQDDSPMVEIIEMPQGNGNVAPEDMVTMAITIRKMIAAIGAEKELDDTLFEMELILIKNADKIGMTLSSEGNYGPPLSEFIAKAIAGRNNERVGRA